MARKTSPKTRLVRSLESATTPVYLVDREFTVVFANQACADWVGIALDQLIGQRLKYSTMGDPEDPTQRLAALCPPPDAFDSPGATFSARIVDQGGARWRSGTVSPVSTDQKDDLLLVVLDASDGSPPESMGEPADPHERLAVVTEQYRKLYALPGLVGTSPHAVRMRTQVQAAGCGRFNVVLVGPAGTGKEHMARVILNLREPDALPIPVHCAVADGELIQNRIREWAGHRQTSSEGAPLLLLDADRLEHDAQAELLGFLRIPEFPLSVIATATQPLSSLVEKNSYHPELASRLSTMVIETVSLAERAEDIPLLVQSMVESFNLKHSKQLARFADDALERLMIYPWNRNLNQLAAVVHDACQSATGPVVTREDLPEVVELTIDALVTGQPQDRSIDLTRFLEQVESELIANMLNYCQGNRSRTATLLGISRPKLLRRIEQLGIEVPGPRSRVESVDVPIFEPIDETDEAETDDRSSEESSADD